jgi:hypothetical protein
MRWLKKLFTQNKKMSLKDKTIEELQEELQTKDFQWLKGEQLGNIEKYKSVEKDEGTGMVFVNFRSGGRINQELLEEYLDIFPAQKVDYSMVNPPVVPNIQSVQAPQISPNTPQGRLKNQVSSVELEESPIYTLLKKQKSNWVNVTISLKLNLPPKNLYNVLISSFDDAEQEIVDYVTEGIDIEDIRSALGKSILSHYDKKQSSLVNQEKNNTESVDGE